MEKPTFDKKKVLVAVLALALGYALFGPVGLLVIALWQIYKAI